MNSPVGALILPMIQGLLTSLRAGAVPQPPQFRPAPAATAAATVAQPSSDEVAARSTDAGKPEADKTAGNGNGSAVPPAVQPAAAPTAAAQVSTAPAAVASPDPLVEAKTRAQEEIKREFAAIMDRGLAGRHWPPPWPHAGPWSGTACSEPPVPCSEVSSYAAAHGFGSTVCFNRIQMNHGVFPLHRISMI
uniref:Uncharacterized protein n=1 Tax=Arundo donax TaxID=35708 RepID=A0A0A9FPB7_ARUDO